MYPGRWNLPGEEAIYTSTEIGVCVLERLVHTPKNRMPADLALMTIKLAGDWSRRGEGLALDQKTGSMWTIYTTLVQGQQEWPVVHGVDEELAAAHVALAIPSVIVPAWNVVLYPRASGFWDHVSLGSVEPFDYDPRLFPDQTPVQP